MADALALMMDVIFIFPMVATQPDAVQFIGVNHPLLSAGVLFDPLLLLQAATPVINATPSIQTFNVSFILITHLLKFPSLLLKIKCRFIIKGFKCSQSNVSVA